MGSDDFPFGIMDVVELLQIRVRRRLPDSVYTDCPICGDRRGKMNVNFAKNIWRCNYCGEYGGMLALYAKVYGTSTSDAYREICDALQVGDYDSGYTPIRCGNAILFKGSPPEIPEGIPQSPKASRQQIHQTYSVLLNLLTLLPIHKEHLMSEKRGLSEQQIKQFGFKSVPPMFLCKKITENLINKGCVVQGVPGFYQDKNGNWTVNFSKRLSGILLPVVGFDGLIQGMQILLDRPIKNPDDPPEKSGSKYLWFSSSSKNMGAGSGSPVLFLGNPCARTVYVTEGILKGYISYALMDRSIASTAGTNNLKGLEELFQFLAENGTQEIIEAQDMDKFSNPMTSKGASQIFLLARKYGMSCRRLTWNPNFKGLDDWQLSLRRRDRWQREEQAMSFKEKYLLGLCEFFDLYKYIEKWHNRQDRTVGMAQYLGLTPDEFGAMCSKSDEVFQKVLDVQRRKQAFRIYQLEFTEERKHIPFAFQGIDALRREGFEQPPASMYKLIWDHEMHCPMAWHEDQTLQFISKHYSDQMPESYMGRALAPSDVVELYDAEQRRYYYVDENHHFVPVSFSPFLANRMNQNESGENKMIVKEAQQVQAPQMELTAYLLCESWFADGHGGRNLWLYTDYEDAKAIFQSKISEENEDGILAKWENHPDRMESSKKDFFECWLDGQYAAYHYSLSITPQKLVMSQNAVSEIYNIQLAANRAEDFLEEISQWEETEDLTEEQLAEMVRYTDISKRIQEKLATNSTYWSAFYESLSEASYEAVKAYLAHIQPPDEG